MGKLIVLEGLDGCGKTTQALNLKDKLTSIGLKTDIIHFPYYESESGEFIKNVLQRFEERDAFFDIMLFALNRLEMRDLLLKKKQENDILIVDRYVFSNIAYNIYKLKSEREKEIMIDKIDDLEFNILELPRPDLVFYLQVPISFIEKNLSKRDKLDNNEIDIKKLKLIAEEYKFIDNFYCKYRIIKCHDLGVVYSKDYITELLFEHVKKIL